MIGSLSRRGIRLVRANLYKFRTSPGSYQGMGEKGVELLARAKGRFGVSLIGEVLGARQAEILAPVIDVYQVGARSMANTALLRQTSHLPVIADVSHCLGRTDIVTPVSTAALSAGASGLMVEVHSKPDRARSDARQQMNVRDFPRFLKRLRLP